MTMLFDHMMILLVLVALSAFFSAAETALFSISMDKAIHLGTETGRVHTLIHRMKNDPDRFLTTIRIGNTLVNISAASLATAATLDVVPENALAIAIGAATFVILIFGEVFPKSVAARNATLIARIVIVPIDTLSKLLYPIVLVLNLIPNMMVRIQRKPKLTEAELLSIVEAGEEDGQIKEEEKELIHNIFELDDTSASEIMTPRADMFVVDVNEPLDLPELFKSGFTRIPVIDGDIDHIIGILNIKDLLRHPSAGGPPADVRKIMREPYFVPEHKKLNNLLKGFKKRKQHMAIVVDEHGGVSGLITLEDALEEIVGEIIDETDTFDPPIVRVSANEWRVMGKTEIEEVNDALLMNIPDTGEYDTFSGYILNLIGRIPQEGQHITIGAFTVVVKEREGNRIVEYLVRRIDPLAPPESTTAPA
jgi:CBS domain containing-hemolysin-like protein